MVFDFFYPAVGFGAHEDHYSMFSLGHPIFAKAFDDAEASNTYSEGGQSLFDAKYALTPSSGYWCDNGTTGDNEVVTWTGKMKHRHWSPGIRINWAYAPGEYKIRVSQDGKHFEDVKNWTMEKTTEASYEQDIEFDRVRPVWGLKVDMREPKDWRYFGINQVHLM